jgi:hypothetical protein
MLFIMKNPNLKSKIRCCFMTVKEPIGEISEDVAVKLCKEIQHEKPARLFSQCWGCLKYSKEDHKKMCYYDPPRNRGCKKINKRFDQQ